MLFFYTASCLASGIHEWRDSNGNVVYGDSPPGNVKSETVAVRPNVYKDVEIESAPSQLFSSHNVVLYSASWCKYCKRARAYFVSHGIPFTEYDVENSAKGRRDYQRLHGHGVPIILVGNHRMNGFSAATFQRLYAEK